MPRPSVNITDKNVRFYADKETCIYHCPVLLLTDYDALELLELYSLYKDGHLLDEGGISNQDYFYIQAMLTLSSEDKKLQSKQFEGIEDGKK